MWEIWLHGMNWWSDLFTKKWNINNGQKIGALPLNPQDIDSGQVK